MRVRDGDGDPVGITGISQPFRGDLYVTKWSSIYRIFRANVGYGLDLVTDEVGCVHHNAMQATMNDIYFVGNDAIHSLALTDKYGAAEAATITAAIYEYFQETVNWARARQMILAYDAPSATLLLSFTSTGSAVNNRILGWNTMTKEFFEWADCEYPSLGKYFDVGRRTTMVADASTGLSLLDANETTLNGTGIALTIETGTIFPLGNPKTQVTFTQAWVLAKPTTKSVELVISYALDGNAPTTATLDTNGEGYGATIKDGTQGAGGGIIGTDLIGTMKDAMIILPFDCRGDGASIRFRLTQTPPALDPEQPCEIYGILYEYEYTEDTTAPVKT